ncbi:MAG: isoprenylcysteine carboxylmethyltransferase family protein [bacterium]
MKIQIWILLIFALNLLVIWAAIFKEQLAWDRPLGSLLLFVLPLLTVLFDQPKFALDYFWWYPAGILAVVMGIGIVIWAGRELKGQGFVCSGPYAYVRHPQYLGLIFIVVGWWWLWAAVYSFYFGMFMLAMIWIQAYFEEKLILEKQFGDQYRDYRRHTGMFWVK